MKILFLCHRVPFPPKRGGKIRPFNIIRHLTASGHQVTVASLARTAAELEESRGLTDHCAKALVAVVPNYVAWPRMVAWLPSPSPSSFAYFHSGRLARLLKADLAQTRYDLVFAHCTSVAPYVESLTGPVKVIDYGDMDSQKWREYAGHRAFPLSAGYWLEAVKLERRERALSRSFDLCTCTTRAELESLRGLGVTTPSGWFPNGVDAEFFAPGDDDYDPDLACFVGRMDYYPNQQAVLCFVEQVLPALRRRRPAARFAIVGADPPERIRRLGQAPGVTVTGSVPDVRPYVRCAALTVAPLEIARGTQNKILESMAMAVPVVCSPQAAGGVDAIPGEHLLVADRPAAWVEQVVGLMADAGRRQHFAAAARSRVLSHHSWPASMARLDRLIEGAVSDKRRAA